MVKIGSPLPKIDGPRAEYIPPLDTIAERKTEEERLLKLCKGHLCQLCKAEGKRGIISVRNRYNRETRRMEFFMWCQSSPAHEPQLYRPETPEEFYERTGTGDAVAIMQVERRRRKLIDRAKERMQYMNKTDMVLFKDTAGQEVGLDVPTIKSLFCEKATDAEAILFLQVCRFQGMNPFLRDAYLIKYDEAKPASIVVGKGFYEKRASEQPSFAGMRAGIVVLKANAPLYREGMMVYPGETLFGGWAEVHRGDRAFPTRIEVSLAEYSKRQATWQQIPATMIRKVALVQALRESFPESFHPIPTTEGVEVLDEEELEAVRQRAGALNQDEAIEVDGRAVMMETGEVVEGPDADASDSPYSDWGVACPEHGEVWKASAQYGKSHFLPEGSETKACYFKTITSRESMRLCGDTKVRNGWLGKHRGGRTWDKLSEGEMLQALDDMRAEYTPAEG